MGLVLSLLGLGPRLMIQIYQLLILVQAELLVFVQPAQLLVGRLLRTNRAHTILTIRLPSTSLSPPRLPGESALDTVVRLLKGLDWAAAPEAAAAQHQLTGGMAVVVGSKLKRRRRERQREHLVPVAGFRITHAYSSQKKGIVKAWYITRHLKWVDAITLELLPTPGCNVLAEARSASTSVVPASVPLAPLWALLLWWLPFPDAGTNYHHLAQIREHLSARHGLNVEEMVVVRGGEVRLAKPNPLEEKERTMQQSELRAVAEAEERKQ